MASTRPPIQAPVIQSSSGILHGRRHIANDEDIGVFEMHIDVAAGMRRNQVTVIDLFPAGFHGSRIKERFGRPRRLRTRFLVAILSGQPVIVRHPLTRAIVRDDLCARRGEHLVIAGLIEVVMSIEEGVDPRIRRQASFSAATSLSPLPGSAAVNQQQTVGSRESDDVAAAAIDHRDLVGQPANAVSPPLVARREPAEMPIT